MVQFIANGTSQVPEQPAAEKTKRKRTSIWILLVVLIIVVLLAVFVLRSRMSSDQPYTFTGYRYTAVYTTHTPLGNNTSRNEYTNDTWSAVYQLGVPFHLNQAFYYNVSDGTTYVTNVECNTPGFSFAESSELFPFTVPTALNASANNNNIMVQLTFNTPSSPYTGPLIYTAYFDYYPPS